MYDYPTFLPGLGEHVVIHKTPRDTVYVFHDGTRVSALEAEGRERIARRAKYGTAGVAFFELMKTSRPDAAVEALVMFDHDIDWEHLEPALAGMQGAEARDNTLRQVRLQIETMRAALAPKLKALGLVTTHAPAMMPAVFVTGTPSALRDAAHLDGVTLVQGATSMRAELHAAKNGVTDSGIDTTFNAGNHWGAGQKIGMYEAYEQGVYDNHEAFALATPDAFTATHPANGVTYHGITYQTEPKNCTYNGDCGNGNYCMALAGC